jgi:hypothetical protein
VTSSKTRAGNVTTKDSKDDEQRDREIEHEDSQGPVETLRPDQICLWEEAVW